MKPAGLSTTTSPSYMSCAVDRAQSAARMRSTVSAIPTSDGEAGGEAVAAAAVRRGDVADVGVADRAEAHLHRAVRLLLEHARDVGLGGAAHDVDEPLDLFDRHVVAAQHVLGHRGPHERLLAHQLGVRDGLGEELQVREAVLLEQRAAQLADRDVERDQLAGQREHAGVGGLVLEAAGVADQRGVEADRGVVVQRAARAARSAGAPARRSPRPRDR